MTGQKEILLEDSDAQLIAASTNCVLTGEDESLLHFANLNARFIGKVKIK